jgi:DNA-binding transcriptional regulator GbsR (MarR family)
MLYRETSREAWEAFVPHSAKLDRQIMETLVAAGKDGITCQEIEEKTGRDHQAVSANLRRLAIRDLVKATKLRGTTKSGRKAIKWVAAQNYNPALHSEDDADAVA